MSDTTQSDMPEGFVTLQTDAPWVMIGMLHDISAYLLTDDGFAGLFKYMEARHPHPIYPDTMRTNLQSLHEQSKFSEVTIADGE
jgi:hypothetical protein